MKNIVILISGGGSNMRALVEYAQTQPNAHVAAVVSNNPDAAGLAFAQAQGIATTVVRHQDYASRADFDVALMAQIDQYAPDVVFLAGFFSDLQRTLGCQEILSLHLPGIHMDTQMRGRSCP